MNVDSITGILKIILKGNDFYFSLPRYDIESIALGTDKNWNNNKTECTSNRNALSIIVIIFSKLHFYHPKVQNRD